jgi:hypothetical protein
VPSQARLRRPCAVRGQAAEARVHSVCVDGQVDEQRYGFLVPRPAHRPEESHQRLPHPGLQAHARGTSGEGDILFVS